MLQGNNAERCWKDVGRGAFAEGCQNLTCPKTIRLKELLITSNDAARCLARLISENDDDNDNNEDEINVNDDDANDDGAENRTKWLIFSSRLTPSINRRSRS